ncbi:MAG: transcriptional regulator NrdR [Planctomycetaceae bacterium]|nr:transcriptional regulator NrdR [Planctomycetaceae bacterium]
MLCPYCHQDNVKVSDTRHVADGYVLWRRRKCLSCGRKFTTHERVETSRIWVLKRSGPRELFDREKLQRGLDHACRKLPEISDEDITTLISQVERDIETEFESEVQSQFIGERVMYYLGQLNQVAYVRFASVYRHFTDTDDFVRELQRMRQNPDMPSLSSEYVPKKQPSRFHKAKTSRYDEQGLLGEEK